MLTEKMKKAFGSIDKTAKTSATAKELAKVRIGAGWDILPNDNVDMDIAAYLCTSDGGKKNLTTKDIVYYNNKERYGVTLVTDTTEGYDEAIDVNLSEIPENITEIIFAISIFNAKEKRQTFRDVLNGYIHIVDTVNKNTLYNLDLKEYEYDECSSIIFAKLLKNSSNKWVLKKVEKGTNGDFTTIMSDILMTLTEKMEKAFGSISLKAFMNDADEMQKGYEKLKASGKITKRDLIAICTPFKNKYKLLDSEVLAIARKEKTPKEITEIYKNIK